MKFIWNNIPVQSPVCIISNVHGLASGYWGNFFVNKDLNVIWSKIFPVVLKKLNASVTEDMAGPFLSVLQ